MAQKQIRQSKHSGASRPAPNRPRYLISLIGRLTTAMLTIASLTLAGCSSSPSHEPRSGGNFSLALWEWPQTFNPLNIDASGDYDDLAKASYPRAFIIQPDGSLKLNTDYFSNVESHGTEPQVVTYTINPRAVWTDSTPITWEDLKKQVDA